MSSERNINYDLMRFLGVLIIMIAHASSPDWIFQLRNFGTPLLIVASALTYSVIYSTRTMDIGRFYRKRLARLIIPAWVFLTFFFISCYFAADIANIEYPFSQEKIITSYLFLSGIGYVWILKVYIILAIITPLSLKISNFKVSNTVYFSTLFLLYLIYEIILYFSFQYIPKRDNELLYSTVYLIMPYALLYLYGMRLGRLAIEQVKSIILVSLTIFIILATFKYNQAGHFVQTQISKYPPSYYYLSYAFFALNSVYLFCIRLIEIGDRAKKCIIWLSANSLWIYLWHIYGFFIWGLILGDVTSFMGFVTKASYMLAFGVILTAIQKTIINKLIPNPGNISKHVKFILT